MAYRYLLLAVAGKVATVTIHPLWRSIGLGRAKEVALTGRIYDAHEAERMGYVSKVFPEGELLSSVDAIARQMAGSARKTTTSASKPCRRSWPRRERSEHARGRGVAIRKNLSGESKRV